VAAWPREEDEEGSQRGGLGRGAGLLGRQLGPARRMRKGPSAGVWGAGRAAGKHREVSASADPSASLRAQRAGWSGRKRLRNLLKSISKSSLLTQSSSSNPAKG